MSAIDEGRARLEAARREADQFEGRMSARTAAALLNSYDALLDIAEAARNAAAAGFSTRSQQSIHTALARLGGGDDA